jgi:Tfp pilus assembly major pilin PilA
MKIKLNNFLLRSPFFKGEYRRSREGGLRGFTLIELLVMVGVFGVILITMSTVLINSTRAKNRTAIIQNLDTNGNMILNKIKYNLVNAIPGTITCPVDGVGTSISFIDKMGVGDTTIISCDDDGKVASASSARAGRQELNSDSVTVSDCGNFISCSPTTGKVEIINVGFTLSAGDANVGAPQESSISRSFSTSVTVRE